MTTDNPPPDDLAAVEQCRASYQQLRSELAKKMIGQDDVIEQVLIAFFAGGHALLEGAAGLAKTLLVSSLAEATRLSFKRIQFTPDLTPGDVTGTGVLREDRQTGRRQHTFLPGPLCANLILADDLNRTPPKTQAAVLEAMQERQLSAGGQVHKLPDPFFVLAAQSPLEQEDAYPLPLAQLDRFLLYVKVAYPSGAEEWEIAHRVTTGKLGKIEPLLSGDDILRLQQLVLRVPVSDRVLGYAWALVRATRPSTPQSPEFVDKWMACGAGPRGVLALVSCAKSRAILHGRYQATVRDVQWIIKPALRHRIAGNYAALANNLGSDQLIDMLLEAVPAEGDYEKPAM
jgi:MoxR-like ATPase